MATSSRSVWPSLTAFFLLFLSLFNIATAKPLPEASPNKYLAARTASEPTTLITQAQYEGYLEKYFDPKTHPYIFYSGKAEDQVIAFKNKNAGYYYYSDLFNAPNEQHPWYKAFAKDGVPLYLDDGEASSVAMAATAAGEVMVFGAIEYQTKGATSFFTLQEIPELHDGLKTGRIKSLIHMVKGATSTSDVLATEDATGKFTWQNGHKEGETNASGGYDTCSASQLSDNEKRDLFNSCDIPKPNKKKVYASSSSSSSQSSTSTSSATATSKASTPASTPATSKTSTPVSTPAAHVTSTAKAASSPTHAAKPTSKKTSAKPTKKGHGL